MRARSLEAEKLHSDLRKLDQLDVMPNRKWANFVKIMESVHGRISIRMKIERIRLRLIRFVYWHDVGCLGEARKCEW